MNDILTVSMPVYNTDPKLLKRAVKSVLGQDYKNLRLVVINDGGAKPALPKDDRIVYLGLDGNYGRYFCDAVTLLSLDFGWFAVHDSDDWSEKKMYSELIYAAEPYGAAFGPYWRHEMNKKPYVWEIRKNPSKKFITRVSWVSGVVSVDRMWKAGGINPSFRVGFDTLSTLLVMRTGAFGTVDVPRYHYEKRPGSLTTDPKTGMKTKARVEARKKLETMYNRSEIELKRKRPLKNAIYKAAPAHIRAEAEKYADKLRNMY